MIPLLKILVSLFIMTGGSFILVVYHCQLWLSNPHSLADNHLMLAIVDAVWLAVWLLLARLQILETPINDWPNYFKDAKLLLYWPLMRFLNVIILRRRLIRAAAVISLLLGVLCAITDPPIYSATCTIDMGTGSSPAASDY